MPRSLVTNTHTRLTPPNNTSATTMALPHSTSLQSAASDVTILCGGMRVQAHSSVRTLTLTLALALNPTLTDAAPYVWPVIHLREPLH